MEQPFGHRSLRQNNKNGTSRSLGAGHRFAALLRAQPLLNPDLCHSRASMPCTTPQYQPDLSSRQPTPRVERGSSRCCRLLLVGPFQRLTGSDEREVGFMSATRAGVLHKRHDCLWDPLTAGQYSRCLKQATCCSRTRISSMGKTPWNQDGRDMQPEGESLFKGEQNT